SDRYVVWVDAPAGTVSGNSVILGNWEILFRGSLDSDGDGLPDTWERDGIDIDGDGTVDLRLCATDSLTSAVECADPLHKDVFVQVDYMVGHRPDPFALFNVEEAFAKAPVTNPDGTAGINLHLQLDDDAPVPHEDVIDFARLTRIKN